MLGFPLFLSLYTADQVDDLSYFSALFFRTCYPCPGGYNVLKAASFLSIQIKGTDSLAEAIETQGLRHQPEYTEVDGAVIIFAGKADGFTWI